MWCVFYVIPVAESGDFVIFLCWCNIGVTGQA